MTRIERITYFENILNEGLEVVKNYKNDPDKFMEFQPKMKELDDYYGSYVYRKDLQADERGELPSDLRRGVLSEDGIYNLLLDNDEILEELKK